MIWPFSARYPLITLQWANRSHFWVLWSFAETPGENLTFLWVQFRGMWTPYEGAGMGCVCDWEFPQTKRWPHWFWCNYYWDRHVHDCPVPRDDYGNVVKS